MGLLVQFGRTLYNVLLLRGRRRRAKLFLLIVLSMAFFVFAMRGMCLVDSRLCEEEPEDGRGLQHTRDVFENAGDYVSGAPDIANLSFMNACLHVSLHHCSVLKGITFVLEIQ